MTQQHGYAMIIRHCLL